MTLDLILTHLQDNFTFYLITGVTLALWDLIELYIELKQLRFVSDLTFGVYYWIRLFFSIALIELVYALDLVTLDNKGIISFITPLLFSTLLQNLVVNVGGGESNINVKEIFDRFKDRIVESLQLTEVRQKAQVMMRLYEDTSIPTTKIQDMCQFHGTTTRYINLTKAISELSDAEKRKALTSTLIEWGGIEAALDLMTLSRSDD
jgi:hypothetical protein